MESSSSDTSSSGEIQVAYSSSPIIWRRWGWRSDHRLMAIPEDSTSAAQAGVTAMTGAMKVLGLLRCREGRCSSVRCKRTGTGFTPGFAVLFSSPATTVDRAWWAHQECPLRCCSAAMISSSNQRLGNGNGNGLGLGLTRVQRNNLVFGLA